MSYARFGADSDVYVYAHYAGFVQCCGCALDDIWDYHDLASLLSHMRAHRDAGHTIPDYLLDPDTYDASDFTPEMETHSND